MDQGRTAPIEVKVCLVGGYGVGKSNIILRFVSNRFDPESKATIGCSIASKSIDINGETVIFNIWDTVGQERFRSIVKQFYRDAAAAIVIYDVTSKASFMEMKSWVEELTKFEPNAILAVAGNKCDLGNKREVSLEEGEQYADQIYATFTETSAKTGHNIDELFFDIGKALSPKAIVIPGEEFLNLGEATNGKRRSSCCK